MKARVNVHFGERYPVFQSRYERWERDYAAAPRRNDADGFYAP